MGCLMRLETQLLLLLSTGISWCCYGLMMERNPMRDYHGFNRRNINNDPTLLPTPPPLWKQRVPLSNPCQRRQNKRRANGRRLTLVHGLFVFLKACEKAQRRQSPMHYLCDELGNVKCLAGWQGDLCQVPICRRGCDPMNGMAA